LFLLIIKIKDRGLSTFFGLGWVRVRSSFNFVFQSINQQVNQYCYYIHNITLL
jgi:hypothetical protein